MEEWARKILEEENALPGVAENDTYQEMIAALRNDRRLNYLFSRQSRLTHFIEVYSTDKARSFQIRADMSVKFGFGLALFGGGAELYLDAKDLSLDLIWSKICLMTNSLYFVDILDEYSNAKKSQALFFESRPTTEEISKSIGQEYCETSADRKIVCCSDFFGKEIIRARL